MKYQIFKDYIVIDELFPEHVLTSFINEGIKNYNDSVVSTKGRGGEDLKGFTVNRSLFLDSVFRGRRDQSIILSGLLEYIWKNKEFYDVLSKGPTVLKILEYTRFDNTVMLFYPNGGFYATHKDFMYDAEINTIDILLKKSPDSFTGGELTIEDEVVEHVNGRVVIFPAFIEHCVKKVVTKDDSVENMRMSIQTKGSFHNMLLHAHG